MTIAKSQELPTATGIETIELARKTNASRLATVVTNKVASEAPAETAASGPDWQPALTAHVAPAESSKIWPAFLIALLLLLTTELMRRHRRRRKRRYVPTG